MHKLHKRYKFNKGYPDMNSEQDILLLENILKKEFGIILENVDKATYKCEQVLKAEAIWAVFYQGAPFNLKTSNAITQYPGPKYKKVSFSNPGHALNLAKKLNETFATEDFTVIKLTEGETIIE